MCLCRWMQHSFSNSSGDIFWQQVKMESFWSSCQSIVKHKTTIEKTIKRICTLSLSRVFFQKVFCKLLSKNLNLCSGLDKFTFTHQIFRVHNFICAPDRAHKINGRTKSKSMCMSDREKTRNNHFCFFVS